MEYPYEEVEIGQNQGFFILKNSDPLYRSVQQSTKFSTGSAVFFKKIVINLPMLYTVRRTTDARMGDQPCRSIDCTGTVVF